MCVYIDIIELEFSFFFKDIYVIYFRWFIEEF